MERQQEPARPAGAEIEVRGVNQQPGAIQAEAGLQGCCPGGQGGFLCFRLQARQVNDVEWHIDRQVGVGLLPAGVRAGEGHP